MEICVGWAGTFLEEVIRKDHGLLGSHVQRVEEEGPSRTRTEQISSGYRTR